VDGKMAYSSIVSLKLKASEWTVRLSGNPVSGMLNVMMNGVSGNAQFLISDLSGKSLYSNRVQNVNSLINIPVNNLPNGVYVLVVTVANEKKSIVFVK
jgi:hypothetical protein